MMTAREVHSPTHVAVQTPLGVTESPAQPFTSTTSTTFVITDQAPAVHRLLVLVPGGDLDEAALAQRIWALASTRGLAVQFLGLSRDLATESHMRRRLTTLAVMTRDRSVPVETRLDAGQDWRRAVKAAWRPDDLVVCHAEQSVRRWGRREPLSQSLMTTLKAPVCTLSGLCAEEFVTLPNLGTQFAFWIMPVAIIAGFFWFQVQITRITKDGLQTTLLCLSVLVEFGLIWVWNRFSP